LIINENRGRPHIVAIHVAVGIEVKNVRPWIYSRSNLVRELLLKCTSIDAVPVMIARRIHFSTFHVLSRCGVIVHQTFNHRLPATATSLAERARDKTLLGFHDIRQGNHPDARLTKFLHENLPRVLPGARENFDRYKDLLAEYGAGDTYESFAGRVRRRSQGLPEDFDEREPEADDFYEPEPEHEDYEC
jgi:hypothetical protein